MLNKAPRSEEGILYHQLQGKDFWIDSMYMSPPFLSAAGHPDIAMIQIEGYRKYLWNPVKKLYHHMWNDELKEFRNTKFWGVGNGWALAGIARVIDSLPKEMVLCREWQGILVFRHPAGQQKDRPFFF